MEFSFYYFSRFYEYYGYLLWMPVHQTLYVKGKTGKVVQMCGTTYIRMIEPINELWN